ncbi:MAG: succinylglutamate desuccinylase/aspartoacylase family protein [Maricaulaceae bacterium]|jgi:predicted deacylase
MNKVGGEAPFVFGGVEVARGSRAVVDLPVSVLSDHTPITLSTHIIHGKKPGPTVFVSAAVHGDEIIGVEIIRRLIRTPQLKGLRGTLLCIPIVNAFGFINHDRYLPDRRDLNRSFPGAAEGSLAARLARLFMTEVVSRCEAGIDLHSAAAHRVNLPQIRIDGRSRRARELAEAFCPPVILTSKLREGSMRLAAKEIGVDVLVYESGEALRFDETAVRIGMRGVLRVLHQLGMIASDRGLKPHLVPYVSRSSAWLRAPMGGILRAYKSIGAGVEEGEPVAIVSDPFGEREEEVCAQESGVIIGRTNLPIVNEGDALFHVAEVAEASKVEKSYDKLPAALEGDPLFDEDEIL